MDDKVQRGQHATEGQVFLLVCPKVEVAPLLNDIGLRHVLYASRYKFWLA
jgi:hypothetical protein